MFAITVTRMLMEPLFLRAEFKLGFCNHQDWIQKDQSTIELQFGGQLMMDQAILGIVSPIA
jgi:hypothetical protein